MSVGCNFKTEFHPLKKIIVDHVLISFQLQWQNMLDCTENEVIWQKM